MDLALRLSEQEASNAAAKRQQEEEAMTEALKESVRTQRSPHIVQPPASSSVPFVYIVKIVSCESVQVCKTDAIVGHLP